MNQKRAAVAHGVNYKHSVKEKTENLFLKSGVKAALLL